MSPNDEITAFILEEYRDGKRALRLALLHTHDILKSAMQKYNLPMLKCDYWLTLSDIVALQTRLHQAKSSHGPASSKTPKAA